MVAEPPRSPFEHYRLAATVTCHTCSKRVDGFIMFNDENQIVDSANFTVFPEGPTCDPCLTDETGMDPATLISPEDTVELIQALRRISDDRLTSHQG